MLDFVKKHQRKFFIVITVMTVSSFVFFGTFSTLIEPRQEIRDRKIVSNIAGKPIMKSELHALCQMIATSAMVPSVGKQAGLPNLFNDGVIEKELLSNGMSMLLSERYFAELKPELEVRVKKMKQFRPYFHPQAPHINALSVYQRFAPTLMQHLEQLKKQSDDCTIDTFALMIQLYMDQALLPSEMLRQILFFQQQQQGVPTDPKLAQGDFSLFGFTSLEEWFGPLFVELNAQFIANAAALAEEKGYAVKKEEIRADLCNNIYIGYKRFAQNDNSCTSQDIQMYFQRKMQQLGLDEKSVLETWRKIMLFRRLFSDVGGSVLIDSLSYKHFQQYSMQNAKIELYEMPSALQFNDFQTMLKFQVYLESIVLNSQHARGDFTLPTQISSIDQIEKRAPELVKRVCDIEYAEVKKSSLSSEISLKDTWEWQTVDAHWAVLQKQFADLEECQALTKLERLEALDKLDSKRRVTIDTFCRQQMMDAAPQKILDALEKAPMHKGQVSLRLHAGQIPFLGLQDRDHLISLLENTSLWEEENSLTYPQNPLYCFSGDNEHFYRIRVLAREEQKRIMSFSEALSDGTLDLLLTQRLEEVYPELRKKKPSYFQVDKGTWKPLKEVKDQVGRFLFSDLLKTIEEVYKKYFGTLPGNTGELPLIFYSNYRLFFHMQEVKSRVQSGSSEGQWVKEDSEDVSALAEPLHHQWLLNKTERNVKRSDNLGFSKEEMFTLQSDQWSAIQLGAGGALAFYKVVEHGSAPELASDKIKQGHEILALDARKQLMQELIALMDQKKAIDITPSSRNESDEP